ncbi:MAG: DUF3734 domain-containing protein [Parvularculaceae bacterium]
MDTHTNTTRPDDFDKKISLVLQGGGALGSYQAGVYEALAEAHYEPDWIAGISIGAINAAIIAGNPIEHGVERLRDFWQAITEPTSWWTPGLSGSLASSQRDASAAAAMTFGQPGFFAPRSPFEWMSSKRPLSYYDTSPLKATIERLVDFDRINDPNTMRLSVGAVNVRTGRFAYFDSADIDIGPEHIMASGALPPGFAPIEIDGEFYWDGGLVSNTPLQHVLDAIPRRSRLTFQVDVFQAYGKLPTSLLEVAEREKDIRYSSRTRVSTEVFEQKHDVRHAINELYEILPEEIRKTEQARRLYELGCVTEMDIVQLIYRPFEPQGASKDFEFSRAAMDARWAQGISDTVTTLEAAPWLAAKTSDVGVRVFDVMHDLLVANKRAATQDAASLRSPAAKPKRNAFSAAGNGVQRHDAAE